MNKNTNHPHECQEPINVDSTVAVSTYRSHKSPVSQGTRLGKQTVIVLYLLLEPIVHSEWQTNCSFVHVGHFYKPDGTQDNFTLKRSRVASDSQQRRFGNSWHWALPLWDSSPFFGIFCTGGEHQCWVWKQGKEPEITRPQRASGTRSICEHSVPKLAYLGDHHAKTCELNACQISWTEEPTIWVELEEIGITEVKCSHNQNSPRTSKLHQDDVFSSVRFGFLLFLFSLFFIPSFSSSIRSCVPSLTWSLEACFFLLSSCYFC